MDGLRICPLSMPLSLFPDMLMVRNELYPELEPLKMKIKISLGHFQVGSYRSPVYPKLPTCSFL